MVCVALVAPRPLHCLFRAFCVLACRALTPHLDSIWSLLWATAGAATAPTPNQPGPDAAPPPVPPAAASGAAAAGPSVAAAVVQHMVRAFAELRQLGALLGSLSAAMRACAAGGDARAAACAEGVLRQPGVQAALRHAVALAPSGAQPGLSVTAPGAMRLTAACLVLQGHGHGSHVCTFELC